MKVLKIIQEKFKAFKEFLNRAFRPFLSKNADREGSVPRQMAINKEEKMSQGSKVEMTLKVTSPDGKVFYETPHTWENVDKLGVITIQRALLGALSSMLDVSEKIHLERLNSK
jgi:hypothetical protein